MINNIKVKICGLRRSEDIQIVNKYNPDYAGFVFAKSKRQISIGTFSGLIKNMNPNIIPVGVYVNQDISFVLESINAGIKIVQLSGDEDEDYLLNLHEQSHSSKIEIWKALRISNEFDLKNNTISYNYINAIILDKYDQDLYGGTGEAFDWNILNSLKINHQVILAGGLNSQNIGKAIEIVKPYCVDVSTGVENDGVKDDLKIRDFIQKVRNKSILSEG